MLKTKEIEAIQLSNKILTRIKAMLQMLQLEELIQVKVILLKVALQLLILPRITIKLKTDKAHQQHIKAQWEHTIR